MPFVNAYLTEEEKSIEVLQLLQIFGLMMKEI